MDQILVAMDQRTYRELVRRCRDKGFSDIEQCIQFIVATYVTRERYCVSPN